MAKESKKGGLGMGLGALIVNSSPINENKQAARSADSAANPEDQVIYVGINDVKPNSDQPRKNFDEEKIEELADSIVQHGVIQPLIVRPAKVGYEIVAGERRYRAARKAGLKKIPCLVRELDDEDNMLIAIIENMQREDLDPIEEAEGLNQMIKTYGFTQDAVSRSVGKSRPYITNAIRLLSLSEDIKSMISGGEISSGHARALLSIKDEKKRKALAEKIKREGLSVRQVENIAKSGDLTPKKPKASRKKPKDSDILSVEDELKAIFGTKVSITGNGKSGTIEMEYYTTEELNRLIDALRTVR